jgi:hypothetical protein
MTSWLSIATTWLKERLIRSSIVHLHQEPVQSVGDLIGLIDRFLFDGVRYPLEWDDFSSWRSDNPHVEKLRLEIASLEPLLFSARDDDREEYRARLLKIRNDIASLLRINVRLE